MPNVRKLTRASKRKGLVYTELEGYPDGTRLHRSENADWLGSWLNIGEDRACVNPFRMGFGASKTPANGYERERPTRPTHDSGPGQQPR